ncbi:hypothetical protein Agub_g858, partial [Astrephomene gubernaculifera]
GQDAFAAPPGRVLPTPWSSAGNTGSELAAKGATPAALTWKSGSQQTLPYDWHHILGQVRYAESLSLQATLEPLKLHRRLVGALLVMSYGEPLMLPYSYIPSKQSHQLECAATAASVPAVPFISSTTWAGGGGGGEQMDAPPAAAGISSGCFRLQRWMGLRKASTRHGRRASGFVTPGVGSGGGGVGSGFPSAERVQGLAAVVAQAAMGPHLSPILR